MIRQILRKSAVFFISLTLISCAINPVTGQKELMIVSESQEVDIGKEFYPNALWGDIGGGGEFKDEKTKAYLKEIVLGIHGVSHRPYLPVQFAIQNSSVPNAWAIPGYVVITRGLLAELNNEAEFVFILGHEMGHVSARHTAKHMTYGILQQIGLGAAGLALSGKEYADIALSLGAVGSSLLLLKYSRDDELEADRLGIQYMTGLGYDPKNAISAHKNLEKVSQKYMKSIGKSPDERGFFEDLLSTHPRTSVRIEEIQFMINRIQPVLIAGDGTNRERFLSMTAALKNTNGIYLEYYDKAARAFQKNDLSEAESLISKAIDADQSQPAFHTLKGFIMVKRKDYSGAAKYFDTAIKFEKDYEPAYRGIGTVMYFQKSYLEGINYLKKSLSLFPQDINAHYFLGMSYYRMSMYKTAIPHLDLFAGVQSKHKEIHGILGTCYENIGELSSAYNEYIMQLKVAPENEMGRYASTRLVVLKPIIEKTKIGN